MKEIYWITTISTLGEVSSVLAIILGITLCFLIPISIMLSEDDEHKKLKKLRNITLIPFVICLILGIFIPSKKDMYIIYGVGGTIDYIQNNDKAKELPDKVINACDAYLESIIKESNNG